jgi:putative peptidoglycan lipid II flippase
VARIARNTVIFSVATGLSRVAGLAREIVASSYFATSGAFSAFTLAFQIPNLLRSLFADAALSAAFVPVFTEMLEKGRRKEALTLASTLFWLILLVLGLLTVAAIVLTPFVVPLLTGDEFTPALDDLTVGLTQVMFPIVVMLGLNGLLVGILNAYDHFSVPALSPVVWNLVILGFLIGARRWFDGDEELYAYAFGVIAGTLVQLAMAVPILRRLGFKLELSFAFRDPRVKRVLILMLPVTIGLGLINFNLIINSALGSLVSQEAPRAIDAAFRIYMLPQGLFSVAIATVLFPALSRLAARDDRDGLRALMATGTRQILLLLIPAAVGTLVLAEPVTRLVYEHGEFGPQDTDRVASALFWFSFSLPFSGVQLLLTRTFFSLQLPWRTTALAGANLAVNAAVSAALYGPFGIQAYFLRAELAGRLEARETAAAVVRMLAAAALLGAVAYGLWWLLDDLLGRSLLAQAISVGTALLAGVAAYVAVVLASRVPEALYLRGMVTNRIQGRRGEGR